MRRILLLILSLTVLFVTGICAQKSVPLPDPGKPDSMAVDNENLYITDEGTVFIYSLADFSLEKKFGRRGEGPGEFRLLSYDRVNLRIALSKDTILVNSISKLSTFTKKGEYVGEIASTESIQFFKPLGDKLAGAKRSIENNIMYIAVNLYNAETLQVEKELFKKEFYVQTEKSFDPTFFAMFMKNGARRTPVYHPYKNKLYVEGENDEILVFDQSGKNDYTIRHPFQKIKVTEEFKQKVLAYLIKRLPTAHPRLIQKSKFREYFQVRWFTVADDKIYVLTFKRIEGKNEIYVLDLKGKLIEKVMVPFVESEFLCAYPYAIGNGSFYQINENPDTEEWELRVTGLKK